MNEMVMGTCILFGVLIVLMAFRFPISFCLAISAMVTGAYLHIPFMNLFQKIQLRTVFKTPGRPVITPHLFFYRDVVLLRHFLQSAHCMAAHVE